VLSHIHRHETRVISAMITGRESLPEDAGDFVFLGVVFVVGHPINAGVFNRITGFVFLGGHFWPPFSKVKTSQTTEQLVADPLRSSLMQSGKSDRF
jgi:hypothetical protein